MNRAFRDMFHSESLNVQEALGYLQVDLWPEVLSLYGDFNAAGGGVTAREALAIVHLPFNTFFKGGRFFPPFGLRVYEDASFMRRQHGVHVPESRRGRGGRASSRDRSISPPRSPTASAGSGSSSSKNVLTSVNGYGMFEEVPVVRNVLAGGSFARQSNQRNVSAFYAGSNFWQFTYLGEFDLIDDTHPAAARTPGATSSPPTPRSTGCSSTGSTSGAPSTSSRCPATATRRATRSEPSPSSTSSSSRASTTSSTTARGTSRSRTRPRSSSSCTSSSRRRLSTSPTPPRSRSGRPARPSGPPP